MANYTDSDVWDDKISEIKDNRRTCFRSIYARKILQKNPGSKEPDDNIYLRSSSEMYLIEAEPEAEAMLDKITTSLTALKLLGEARDSIYYPTVFATKEGLMEQIKLQRDVPLYGEGFL